MLKSNLIAIYFTSLIAYCLPSTVNCIAQQYNFRNYNVQDGLIQSQVNCIIQDSRGYLWIGTWGGLSRYDGKKFKTYTTADGLPHAMIYDMLEDDWGNIWLTTRKGAAVFDGKKFTTYTTDDGLVSNYVNKLFKDSRGNIWFLSKGKGISVMENGRWMMDDGKEEYDSVRFTNYTDELGLKHNWVTSIMEDSQGNIWIGTGDAKTEGEGVLMFDTDHSLYPEQRFINYSTKNGLINNNIRDFAEDNNGNIWIATVVGVSVYITPARYPQSQSEAGGNEKRFENIYGDEIYAPFAAKGGYSGVGKLFKDSEGNIWFLGYGTKIQNEYVNILSMLDASTLENIKDDNRIFKTFICKHGTASKGVFEDQNGTIWFIGSSGFSKYNPNEKPAEFRIIHDQKIPVLKSFTSENGLNNADIRLVGQVAIPDREGNLWLGHDGGGITKFSGETFQMFTTKDGLGDNNIWAFCEDKDKNIWVGLNDKGVSKINLSRSHTGSGTPIALPLIENYNLPEITGELSSNTTVSIFQDSKKNIWFGNAGGVITRLNFKSRGSQNNPFKTFIDGGFMTSGGIWDIVEDRQGNLWFGTLDGGVWKYSHHRSPTSRGAPNTTIYEKLQHYTTSDHCPGLLSNNIHYNWNKLETMQIGEKCVGGLPTNACWDIHLDPEGNLWFATPAGVSMWDGEKFTNFTTEHGLVDNDVNSIQQDTEKNIFWFGTGSGISRFRLTSKDPLITEFQNYTTKDGLSSNIFYLLLLDNDNNLWAGSNMGLDKLFINEEGEVVKIKHYGLKEGFMGVETALNAVCKDSRGNLWFGTVNGAVKYNPKEDRPNTTEPVTHITSIKLFNKTVDWSEYADSTDFFGVPYTRHDISIGGALPSLLLLGLPIRATLKLPYNQNHLTFEYIGICLTIPEKVFFQYMLEGADKEWSPIVEKTSVTYSNLERGNYVFKVKACNNDGVWNKHPATYQFRINPPWWKTWWFYTAQAMFFIVLIGITFWYSHHINPQSRLAKKQARIATILIFVCLFIIFEFIQTLLEPWYEKIVGAAPIITVLLNLALASILFPVQTLLRAYLRGRKMKKMEEGED